MVLDSPIWTIKEVADYMRVSESHVRNAIKGRVADTPRLPAIKMGRRIRILRDELYGWLLETQGKLPKIPAI